MRATPRLAVLVTFSLALLPGCGATGTDDRPPTSVSAGSAAADGSGAKPDTVAAERPEGLADYLPVPPGTLVSAKPETSAWEYVYGDISSDDARSFADWFTQHDFDSKVHVDSGGKEQWYFQNTRHAVKLEHTHADDRLRYWVDVMS
ncbi:hypothetical protein ACIA59_04085 [Micromonospora haikouensis]|uniref:hypothetical protein n=1 Tax=Micromonospora haikouensis TaxID=686309 RepID=UPI00378EDFBC